ncbi:Methyltransf-2 domain-containing protein [Mycena indigotica]|uniref:Methyltransf-2 domain-containing protein n=1 Tax=Mycena indigotica TaxID=2126181 RepID=A0A8H6SBC9_9AGAR|nr:Methyltransf-2 domain-containing protein [Mycena indigotica]KAF7295635.1 Methyltransf-2 domain-containing protein [Mycena indigotica]
MSLPDLLALLTTSINNLTSQYASAGHALPSLDTPYDPKSPAETFRLGNTAVVDATKEIIAAASQIIVAVRDPVVGLFLSAHSGASAEKIASYSGVDAGLLERVLRLLATHHIFREIGPGIFTNNRVSSAMDKGKSVKDLLERPSERFSEPQSGRAAHVEFLADECFRSASVLADTMRDPKASAPLLQAFNQPPTANLFSFLETSPARLGRFSIAMDVTMTTNQLADGYPWVKLATGDKKLVVDVGAGMGGYIMGVARQLGSSDKIEFVIQDREKTVVKARKNWEEHLPEVVTKGLVKFEPQDFFNAQPSRSAPVSVFVLRHILHNWPNAKATQILRRLRDAASAETQLLIIDRVVRPASLVESAHPEIVESIPGAKLAPAPAPLLPNWGVAGQMMYHYDLTMHNLLGATERTVDGFVALLRGAGWELVRIHRDPHAAQSSNLVARPIF